MEQRVRTFAFSFLGGYHQFLHTVPIAAALSHRTGTRVIAWVNDATDADKLRSMLKALEAGPVEIVVMALPGWLAVLASRGGTSPEAKLKVIRLLLWANRIRQADVIVAAERTSILLKRLPGRCPTMVQIPHGAGDGAKGYDSRIRLFDYTLVAGEKDRQRLIDMGLMRAEQVSAIGYVKLAGLQRIHGMKRPRFFLNDRPTVLYNPHFNRTLSSWTKFGRAVIDAIERDGRFNLIVAPHVRLFEGASPEKRAEYEALGRPDRVLIDLGSERSVDMSYTLAADIYLGDVSSQVYEFCAIPRPCVFINSHATDWQESPFYSMWHLGKVIGGVAEVMPALEAALAHPNAYAERQREAVRWSFGDPEIDAAEVAAAKLLEIARAA